MQDNDASSAELGMNKSVESMKNKDVESLKRKQSFVEKPHVLLSKLDHYSQIPRPPSLHGGMMTMSAGVAAAVYCVFLVLNLLALPPTTKSTVEWSDTQGPFPMTINCTAPSGCLISNQHNQWSSNGDKVLADQQRCFPLAQGQQYVLNFTFTQDPSMGLIMSWDPTVSDIGVTPGSGVTIRADTNCPSCPDGIYPLYTPVVGGVYLANMVVTQNDTSPFDAAKSRREWFVTYASANTGVDPSSPCYATMGTSQRAKWAQSNVRIMSQWYLVQVQYANIGWLQVLGMVGGTIGLFLQVGGAVLVFGEKLFGKAFRRINPEAQEEDHNVYAGPDIKFAVRNQP